MLCRLKGIYPSRACIEIGLSAGAFNKWDEYTIPRGKTLQKAAEFFGVKPDYLLVDAESWVAYNGTYIPATANDAPLEYMNETQKVVESDARAARRMQIIDRTADMTLAQLEQVIGMLDLLFPGDKNGN